MEWNCGHVAYKYIYPGVETVEEVVFVLVVVENIPPFSKITN